MPGVTAPRPPPVPALLALLALAACAAAPSRDVRFRDPAAPLYSVAAFDPARLPGRWTQTAALAAPGAPACAAGGVEIAADLTVRGRLCLDGVPVPVSGALRPVGPGRVQVAGADPSGIGAPWWIVWADEGLRTLAVATPSGAFGFVLDRTGATPPDRLAAAAELFDFNGHDRRLLRPLR